MAASATFALKAGVWFRRGRLIMVSPDSQATACPPSGRNSTYRPVQISGASSDHIGRSVRDTVPQVADQVEHIVQTILRTGEPITGIEVNGQRSDGSKRRLGC